MTHPDFDPLVDSYALALDADGYSTNSRRGYLDSVRDVARYLAEHHPDVGPCDLTRDHVRAYLVHVRDTRSASTARARFAGLRSFTKWLVAEGEVQTDPTQGIKSPNPPVPETGVLSLEQIRAILGTCSGSDFRSRRDAAIIRLFSDAGLRLSEMAGLAVDDLDLREKVVIVRGKGANRSGPRMRGVPIGAQTTRALDRYLRVRRKHPHADRANLWLGARSGPTVSPSAIKTMVERRAERSGSGKVHPHMFRHTFAHQWLVDGGTEGDLMRIGGWRSRVMLDRYGASVAAERARDAHRQHGLGDRL